MANKKPRDYVRNPFPKVFTEADLADKVFQTATDYELKYHNKSNETSEIEKIIFKCPPLTEITIQITKSGQKQTIHEQVYAKDINYSMNFKDLATDKTLTTQPDQYLYILLRHAYISNQQFTIIVNKDQLLWSSKALSK